MSTRSGSEGPDMSGCRGCVHFTPKDPTCRCNYLLDTGHSRGCPVAGCNVKTIGCREVVNNMAVFLPGSHITRSQRLKFDPYAARELWKAGRTDPEIAEALGVAISTVWQWRQDNSLEPRAHGRPRGAKLIPKDEARRLYDMGLTDAQLAEALGCTYRGARGWRLRSGLPLNKKRRADDGQGSA